MAFSPQFMDELRARVRVSEVAARRVVDLKQVGADHVGTSPFEGGGKTFTANDERGVWHDFSADKYGDIFDLLQEVEGLGRDEAVRVCADIAGVPLPNGNSDRGAPSSDPQAGRTRADDGQYRAGIGGGAANGNGAHEAVAPIVPTRPNGHYQAVVPDTGSYERDLLGILLNKPELLACIEEDLDSDDFSVAEHGRLYGTLAAARAQGYSQDIRAIVQAFGWDQDEENPLPGIQAGPYVARLMADAPLLAQVGDLEHFTRELARAVRTTAELRRGDIEPEIQDTPRGSKFGLVMWSDRNQTGEQYEYLVEDLIPVGEAVLIVGESQSGKSFFTLDMAMGLARGTPFFGRRVLNPMGVVYCAYEGGKGFRNRLRAYAARTGVTADDIPFAVLTRPADLWSNAVNIDQLISEIRWIVATKFKGIPLGAVVIDTHNAATPGASEIDSKEVSTIRERYRKIITETGAGVWIIGHKNAAGRHRGNEQLYNNIETAIDISLHTKVEEKVVIPVKDAQGRVLRGAKVLKQREGQQGPLGDFVLPWVGLGIYDRYGKERGSCVIEAVDKDAAIGTQAGEPEEKGLNLLPRDHVMLTALRDAIMDKGQLPPGSLQLPQSIAKVVEGTAWFEMYRKQCDPDEKDASIKKALQRCADKLVKMRIIGRDRPYFWLSGRPVKGIIGAQPKSIIPDGEMPSGLD